MKTVRTADRELSIVDVGHGPPVLLVHGFPLNHAMWEAQIGSLSERYRVLAPDLCGFGGSRPAGADITMDQFADDLNGLLDALGVAEGVVYCGLSMGGYIGWAFWRRFRERVRAFVLCDTRAAADAPEAAAQRLDTAQHVLANGVESLADGLLPRLLAESTLRQRPSVVDALRRMILASSPQGVAAALRGMASRSDAQSLLPLIRVPSLLVVGRDDALSPPEEMQRMCDAMPNARLAVVQEAGHMAPMENPEAVNQVILEFLTTEDL